MNLHAQGRIRLECFRDGKKIWDTGFIPNIITYVGYAAVAGLAGNIGSVNPFTYLAVGTSNTAVSAADTALNAEISTGGLSRAAATVSLVTTAQTNDTLQLYHSWTSSSSFTVQEAGILNAASTGTLLGHVLTGAKSVASGDVLQGTYQIQFS